MRATVVALAGFFALLPLAEAAAQGYRRAARPAAKPAAADEEADEEEEPAEDARPRKKAKKLDAKGLVEDHLRERLSVVQRNWHDQKAFGVKMGERWEKFFAEINADRKRFEASIARQRLNLFDTMASVGPSYQAQSVADFERMQSTMLKSFEASQKEKMDEFFGRLMEDIKSYSIDQDRKRSELVAVSMDAWKEQRGALDERKGKEQP
ncbi:MAG: hypothetical protein HYZ75_09545 [Elusimicrobia bacterium]|nr:hypothetical protein [Elusimicrobiota bacterium]